MKKWTHWFPADKFRQYQEEYLCKIVEAHKRTDVVFLRGPCGSGKSLIALTLAKYYKTSYIATVEKILQDQYYNDYASYLVLLKGKSNYSCGKVFKDDYARLLHYSCANAPCGLNLPSLKNVSKECEDDKICPYIDARNIGLKESPITLLNFHNLVLFATQNIPKRQLLVLDECHNLERVLYSFAEIHFTAKAFASVRRICNEDEEYQLEHGFVNIEAVVDFCLNLMPRMRAVLDREPINTKEEEDFIKLEAQYEKMQDFTSKYENGVRFVVKPQASGCIVSPLFVDHIAPLALSLGNKILLMSATIADAKNMAKNLGIKEFEFLDIPSTFPPENRPVVALNVGSMSYTKIDDTMPTMVKYIKAILKKYPKSKGVIQTYSYKITERLQELILSPRLLFQNRDTDKQRLLEEHCESDEPTVLVGPGFKEGVDLFEDRCRFMIIIKMPFADIKDPIIAERMKLDRKWYQLLAVTDIIQMLGRGVRSKTDKCDVFILDSSFEFLYKDNLDNFPKDIRQSVVFA